MKHNSGFTLLEIIVVISVIALLAAALTPVVINVITEAKISRVASDVRGVRTALEAFQTHTGVFPRDNDFADPNLTTSVGLNAAVASNWRGPYLKRWPTKHGWQSGNTWDYDHDSDGSAPCNLWNYDGIGNNTACLQIAGLPAQVRGRLDATLDDAPDNAADANNTGNVRVSGNNLVLYVGEGTMAPAP